MEWVCEKCGSPIKEGSKFCTSCGSPIRVEQKAEPQRPVYTDGLAYRNKAELLAELTREQQYFAARITDYDEIIRITNEKINAKPPKTGTQIFVSGLTTTIGSIIMMILGVMFLIIGLAVGLVMIVIGIVRELKGNKPMAAFEQQQEARQARINDIEQALKQYHAAYGPCLVAYKYSDPKVIQTLISTVQSGKADSIKEAIHSMETDMYNAEMLRLQKETAANTKKAAEAASTAVTFSAASFVRGIK